ncbi:MAG: hypothetical protein RLZZ21_736 [Planctomycetota bacterium]
MAPVRIRRGADGLPCWMIVAWSLVWLCAPPALAAEPGAGPRRCVVLDVYAREDDAAEDRVVAAAEAFARDHGGLVVVRRLIASNPDDRDAFAKLSATHGFAPDKTPVFHACGRVAVDCDDPAAVAKRATVLLQMEVFTRPGCGRCAAAKAWLPTFQHAHPGVKVVTLDIAGDAGSRQYLGDLVREHRTAAASVPVFHVCNRLVVGFDRPETSGRRLAAVLEPWTRPCPEPIGVEADVGETAAESETSIDLPVIGTVDARILGMPLFTLAIGLVDGFNPCAMWVLLLLLSILVNVQDRLRILAIAGTFVLVSGLAYFAFMAAWLHVFDWIGCLRPVQIALGLLAITIGSVHVKDFFAFKQGLSLSIPEAAKPGIYDRMRRIVTAENLLGAILGAFTLAVLVNIVELLCTAGLPALYTNVLSLQGYSTPVRYGYLGLYIAAYMFDDALMVAGVVATLSRFRLQETGGRWLKLVSGAVILLLGCVMLFRPDWLG